MYSDFPAFMRFILENPTDFTCRGVFADWLEENGETDFAATIRAGIELHRAIEAGADVSSFRFRDLRSRASGWEPDCESKRLRKYGKTEDRDDFLATCSVACELPSSTTAFDSYAVVDRGFISKLYCSKKFFWKYGKEAFLRHPITSLHFTSFSMITSQNHNEEIYPSSFMIWPTTNYRDDAIFRIPIPGSQSDKGYVIGCTDRNELELLVSRFIVDFMRDAIGLPPLNPDIFNKVRKHHLVIPDFMTSAR